MGVEKRSVFVACVSLLGALGLLAACSLRDPDESSAGAQQAEGADPIPGDDWMARVERQLAEREYQASHNGAGLQAPNRKHGLRTYFEPTGIRVHDRTAGSDSELMGLSVAGVGRGRELSPLAPGEVSSEGARVEIRRDGFVEWFVNSAEGLEQGFTLSERPRGEGPLVVELELTGAKVSLRGDGAVFDTAAQRKLEYAKLASEDVSGRSLASHFEVRDGARLRIVVDDADAVYPLVIDPLLSETADTQVEANQASALLGWSVAGVGDVNGDGYADVIVGAYQYDAGQTNEGAAFVFLGSAAGIADGNPATAIAQLESNQAGGHLGRSVAGAGDVNGDGYADVIVSSPLYDAGQMDEGAAFVFLGSSTGIAAGNPLTAAAQLESDQASAQLGWSVAGAGDVNADGYADVIVGDHLYDGGQADEGAAFVFLGSASGVSDGNPATAAALIQSDLSGSILGRNVAGAGDVNGDGYADVVVGAPLYDVGQVDEGVALVFLGSATGIPSGNSSAAATIIQGQLTDAKLGMSVAGAGDVNGDGYADVVIGANTYSNGEVGEGAAFVFLGSAAGIPTGSPAAAVAQLESNQANAQFGFSVGGAGDVNGDGYADVIVSAFLYDAGQADEGAAFVFLGSSVGIVDGNPATAASQIESDQINAWLGVNAAGAGDVNGDGYADVIVGAHMFDAGQTDEGAAFVFLGASTGIADGNPSTAGAQLEAGQSSAQLGWSVAGAGDVNRDGYSDVIVGANTYDSGELDEGAAFVFLGSAAGIADGDAAGAAAQLESNQAGSQLGWSVAGTGDVNGDGYGDVMVGARFYDSPMRDEGAAFLFLGSSTGIADGNPSTAAAQLESNLVDAKLGWSVAGAGDVNGDGFADVIVGSPYYYAGCGFVFLGSSSGIADGNPATAASTLCGDEAYALGGWSVAGAGDVNGDGYADVIVGVPGYDEGLQDEGVALVFLGSATGIADGTPPTAAGELESNQEFAALGASVAGAGDVNGDGYADVIVGAAQYSNGSTWEGAAFVFLGSASGITDGSAATAATRLESNQVGARLGWSVAGAGDVNGDGYADVIVSANDYDAGEADEGAAFVFLGSPSGIADGNPATAAAQLESNQAGASFGRSVAGVGDVNGDGYADVVVGAELYDAGEADEGAAFAFLGNGGGRPVLARQRGDATGVPLQPWGISWNPTSLTVEQHASHPAGRGRVALELEACPPGVPFGHASCAKTTTPSWVPVNGVTPEAVLSRSLSGLPTDTLYRWRERVLHAPATGPLAAKPAHGPWRRLNAQAGEADIRLPEPGAALLLGSGIALLGVLGRRRRLASSRASERGPSTSWSAVASGSQVR